MLKEVTGPDEHGSVYIQLRGFPGRDPLLRPLPKVARTIEVSGVSVLVDLSETGELLGIELLSVPRDGEEAETVRTGSSAR